jgi:hypothetical protein
MTSNNKALNESLIMAFICSFGQIWIQDFSKNPIPKITKRRILVTRQALQDQPNANKFGSKVLAKKS